MSKKNLSQMTQDVRYEQIWKDVTDGHTQITLLFHYFEISVSKKDIPVLKKC
jgi:hypothetical protein